MQLISILAEEGDRELPENFWIREDNGDVEIN
jgi:hypothetical protein